MGWGGEHRAREVSAGLGDAGWAGSGGGKWHGAVGASGGERRAGEVNTGLGSVGRAGSSGRRWHSMAGLQEVCTGLRR